MRTKQFKKMIFLFLLLMIVSGCKNNSDSQKLPEITSKILENSTYYFEQKYNNSNIDGGTYYTNNHKVMLKRLYDSGKTYGAIIDGGKIELYEDSKQYFIIFEDLNITLKVTFISTNMFDKEFLNFKASNYNMVEDGWIVFMNGKASIKLDKRIVLEDITWEAMKGNDFKYGKEMKAIIENLKNVKKIELLPD